jgi:hypothetical protein
MQDVNIIFSDFRLFNWKYFLSLKKSFLQWMYDYCETVVHEGVMLLKLLLFSGEQA